MADLSPFFEWIRCQELDLDPEQKSRFEGFQARLYEANRVMNLTRVPVEECWWRHFVDSLLFQNELSNGSSVLDVGTGPGFPAWPLACARPDLQVTAIDSNGKMLAFLESSPLPNLTVIKVRAEEWGVRDKFDYVTGRALAPLPVQLELSAGPCRLQGTVCPMRTPNDLFDPLIIGTLGLSLVRVEIRRLPHGDVERALPIYVKAKSTPKKYPRRWAEIKPSD